MSQGLKYFSYVEIIKAFHKKTYQYSDFQYVAYTDDTFGAVIILVGTLGMRNLASV